jgi:hypothetical protein
MTREPLPLTLRWLLNCCLAALSAIRLADVLVTFVQRYVPHWLMSVAWANRYWPLSSKVDYVRWLYSAYLYEALIIGLIGGLLTYWKVYDRIRPRAA